MLDGCFGVFTDRKTRIISSTDERFQVGESLDVDPTFFTLPKGESTAKIIEFHGYYYAVGSRTSAGYREYKVNDGYENDVIGMVFVPLAEIADQKKRIHRRRQMGVGVANTRVSEQDCMELATFYIGNKWLGINATKVREAINSDGITTIPGAQEFVIGKLLHNNKVLTIIDIRTQLRLPDENFDTNAPIVVMETESDCVGLVVDALGEIPQVNLNRVDLGKNILDSQQSYIECIIKPADKSDQKDLLVVLDPAKLVRTLIGTQH